MFETKPIKPPIFWQLVEYWMRSRVTPGALWQPSGWSRWAAADLQSYVLDHALTEAGSHDEQSVYDITADVRAIYGSEHRIAMALNLNHPEETIYLLDFHLHSPHQSTEEYSRELEAALARLETARLVQASAQPAIVAMTMVKEIADHLITRREYGLHFELTVPGFGGERKSPTLYVLSRIAERALQAAVADSTAEQAVAADVADRESEPDAVQAGEGLGQDRRKLSAMSDVFDAGSVGSGISGGPGADVTDGAVGLGEASVEGDFFTPNRTRTRRAR